MKKLLIVLLSLALLLGTTGCREKSSTEEDIRKIAQLIKLCEESGGKSKVGMFGNRYCEMPDASVVR